MKIKIDKNRWMFKDIINNYELYFETNNNKLYMKKENNEFLKIEENKENIIKRKLIKYYQYPSTKINKNDKILNLLLKEININERINIYKIF